MSPKPPSMWQPTTASRIGEGASLLPRVVTLSGIPHPRGIRTSATANRATSACSASAVDGPGIHRTAMVVHNHPDYRSPWSTGARLTLGSTRTPTWVGNASIQPPPRHRDSTGSATSFGPDPGRHRQVQANLEIRKRQLHHRCRSRPSSIKARQTTEENYSLLRSAASQKPTPTSSWLRGTQLTNVEGSAFPPSPEHR